MTSSATDSMTSSMTDSMTSSTTDSMTSSATDSATTSAAATTTDTATTSATTTASDSATTSASSETTTTAAATTRAVELQRSLDDFNNLPSAIVTTSNGETVDINMILPSKVEPLKERADELELFNADGLISDGHNM